MDGHPGQSQVAWDYLGMPELSYPCVACHKPAADEYQWYTDDGEYGDGAGQAITWHLCEECCDFAIDVVECISELDNEEERALWTLNESGN